MNSHFFTAPFYFAFIWFRVQGSRLSWRLRRNYTYDDTRSPFVLPPSFGRRCPEVAEVGRVKRYSHFRGNQPRLASLVCPLPEEGARMMFKETLIKSLSFAVRDSRPHMCRAPLRFPHLSFIPPVPYPPLRGTFPSRGRLRYENSVIS